MRITSFALVCAAFTIVACSDDTGTTAATTDSASSTSDATSDSDTTTAGTESETGEDPEQLDTFAFANGCYALRNGDSYLSSANGSTFAFDADQAGAARFFMKASDLSTYLFYDEGRGYLVSDDGPLLRQTSLLSDVMLFDGEYDDNYVSGAEWLLETSTVDPTQYQLRNLRNDLLMTDSGLAEEGLPVTIEASEGCTEHPEASLDASGTPTKTTFDDGDLYGIVDTHSHILSNFAFGGGGIFHGEAFHPLGVEHALGDCDPLHGEMGRKDFFGFAFDASGADAGNLTALIPDLIAGELQEDNHVTDGWPTFSGWPLGPRRSTHQTQYWRWLERAWLSGLRLVIQHATTNEVICNFIKGQGIQPTRYECNDMTAVDRILDETYAMQDYIDAQFGGPGEGFFRIVSTPAEARAVIEEGKMAVVLGIETANLFECTSVPRPENPECDIEFVREQLDYYESIGVRALFPVHKYDNQFTPGDGDRAFIELGNFLNSGHWSNFTEDCPEDVTDGFDRGDIFFGGLNMPRDEYLSDPPNDTSNYANAPVTITSLYLNQILEPPAEGDFCQNATLTPLGEQLLDEMMMRGMIIEVDHFPQWSYKRVFEILVENQYPAAGTHGRNYGGLIYELGGISKTGLGTCRDPNNPGAQTQRLRDRVQQITEAGGYPAEGFGFDLNGFAGAPGPRFGDNSGCGEGQTDPVTYPFTAYGDDVEFTQPMLGERMVDFSTEGLTHIGMLPELIEDARKDAIDEADLEPLFRSAEGYIRMWELAEQRAQELAAERGLSD